jgi:IS30 family transposase
LYTIISDNGKEPTEHERIAQELGIEFFVAPPYAAWGHAANENMNGLARQYIPNNRNLASITNDDLEQIKIELTHLPRKNLDIKSPFEVFLEQPVALIS